jgi:quercetin dioxygenase-like cupin family protein
MQVRLSDIQPRDIAPGYRARFVHSAHMTFAHWEIDAGAPLPEHAHPHEQVVHVVEGRFDLVVDGQTHALSAGEVFIIPSNAVHSGFAVTDCWIVDAFYPVREEYRS